MCFKEAFKCNFEIQIFSGYVSKITGLSEDLNKNKFKLYILSQVFI